MRDQGTRRRAIVALLCLGALAAVFATAIGGGNHLAGPGDADGAAQVPPPAQQSSRTSPNAYFLALRQAQRLTDPSGPTLSWSGVGQGPITGGYGPSAPGGGTLPPWSGRGTSIAVAPSSDHVAYLGTSGGGLWKTTDDGVNWTAVFDSQSTLAIGAVAVDPTNPDIVYAGTGEANWQLDTGEMLLGDGIYRSTDGGSTWSRTPIPFASGYMGGGCAVSSIAVDPATSTTLVAGVYCPGTSNSSATAIIRSTNSGANWSGVGPAVGGAADQAPYVTFDPSDSSGHTWYATISATGGLGGVWKSTDAGATWTQKLKSVPDADASAWTAPRGVVAVAPTDPNRLYALFEQTFACTGSHCLECGAGACGNAVADPQLLTSDDAGATWTPITNTDSNASNETDAQYLCGQNQCSSTLTMAVSPANPSVVYIGTLNPAKVALSGSSSTMAFLGAPIHADERAFAFDPDGRLWVANDGGIYRFRSEATMDTNVDNLNTKLPTVQVYRLSVDTAGDVLIATQDIGCDLYTPAGGWKQLGWGAGGTSEPQGCGDSTAAIISAVHPGVMYAEVQFDMWLVRSLDGGQSIDHIQLIAPDCQYSICAPFMDPMVEDPSTGDLLGGDDSAVWRSTNPNAADRTTVAWEQISPKFDWYPSTIAAAPSDGHTIYVGSSAYSNVTNQMGIEVTHDGGGTDPANWSLGSGCCGTAPVTDIEVDPTNPNHAYATTSSWPPQSPRAGISGNGAASQVYETKDGGASWQAITGSLPAAPYNAVSVDWGFSKHTIYVATDVGVFWSEDDGQIWHATSQNLPTVPVEDLQVQTVSGNKSLYGATFGRGVYSVPTITTVLQTLSVARSGAGSGTIASTSPSGISCGSTCAYDFANNATVTLSESPSTGSSFAGWSGGGCSGTATTCQVTMSAAQTVTATFTVDQGLTVSKSGAGSGSVTSSPSGIDCGATCSHSFADGTPVTLTATPDAGSAFSGWSGDCAGTGTCQVTMSAAHSVTATFLPDESLTVAKSGAGSGSVTSSPSGVDCGSTCSHSFANGTQVTLTATAAAGSSFAGWSGDCTGTGTCQVTMEAAHSVTATFTSNPPPPPPPPPAKCHVPKLVGKTLAAAKNALRKAHCSLGKVKKSASKKKKGTVIAQSPAAGKRLGNGAAVTVTVSTGRKH